MQDYLEYALFGIHENKEIRSTKTIQQLMYIQIKRKNNYIKFPVSSSIHSEQEVSFGKVRNCLFGAQA